MFHLKSIILPKSKKIMKKWSKERMKTDQVSLLILDISKKMQMMSDLSAWFQIWAATSIISSQTILFLDRQVHLLAFSSNQVKTAKVKAHKAILEVKVTNQHPKLK